MGCQELFLDFLGVSLGDGSRAAAPGLTIEHCRSPIEKAAWQLPPACLSNRHSAIDNRKFETGHWPLPFPVSAPLDPES
jgi:hypothetical protein